MEFLWSEELESAEEDNVDVVVVVAVGEECLRLIKIDN